MNKIYNEDCLTGLSRLESGSINCCVTSPPYFGLRDYGVAGQMGLEESPDEYVAKMVEVFREVRRALRDDGTLWLNIGDSYNSAASNQNGRKDSGGLLHGDVRYYSNGDKQIGRRKILTSLKPKDLIGIPWMLAFALRADGWYLRQDIIWAKRNCMPESVTDRCTKSHEHIFMFSKSQKYFYDQKAIMEPIAESTIGDRIDTGKNRPNRGFNGSASAAHGRLGDQDMRNKRDVWFISPAQFSEAHFATFPEEIPATCIKAGCPVDGLVLDPFMGAGTTALVARKLNRNFVGFELNPEYVRLAERRLDRELGLFK